MHLLTYPFAALGMTAFLGTSAFAQIEPIDPLVLIPGEEIPGDFAVSLDEAAEGRAMFLAGEYVAALEVLQPLADAGNPVAQNIFGVALTELNGAYVPYDPEAGFRYLLAAGEQGFGPAMHNLGDTYEETHEGFAPDLEASTRWYLTAAELGYETAFYDTGYALVYGHGIAEDYDAGRAWLERALEGEERRYALVALGDLAYFGWGQEEDAERSLELYLQAADAGNPLGAWYAAYQFLNGEGTGEDDAAALPLLEQAVDGGEMDAIGDLALVVSRGAGAIPADPDRAFLLAQDGDEQGLGFPAAVLGDFYRLGVGTDIDLDQARAAYERGQARGNVDAVYQLGDMAYFGRGEPQDYQRALTLFREAMAINPTHWDTIYSIAYMQMRGEGSSIDIAAATDLLEQSIQAGHVLSIVEAIELFGSSTYAGPQTDEVRAYAHCIRADAIHNRPQNTGDIEDHLLTCARLTEELSAEDRATAAVLAQAM